jgi:hypothetical protein
MNVKNACVVILLATTAPALAYEADVIQAANEARVPVKDMQELVTCITEARAYHPEWGASREKVIKMAFALEAMRTLGDVEGQSGAMAACNLLRDLK